MTLLLTDPSGDQRSDPWGVASLKAVAFPCHRRSLKILKCQCKRGIKRPSVEQYPWFAAPKTVVGPSMDPSRAPFVWPPITVLLSLGEPLEESKLHPGFST